MFQLTTKLYNTLKTKVTTICSQLFLKNSHKQNGRPLAIKTEDALTLGIFKQLNGITTKKALYDMAQPNCSYKTLVESINRVQSMALYILMRLLRVNEINSHIVKHTDSTELPVCSVKRARAHRTMRDLAHKSKSSKGWFYGLKLHLTSDLTGKILRVAFSSGNSDDRAMAKKLNRGLRGVFVFDAGYVSKEFEQSIAREGNLAIIIPRVNMKRLASASDIFFMNTRMLIELKFRSLKMFYGLITSLPRSVDGYLANYVYALLAGVLA